MAAEHDFRTWPRREEAAKQLGISVATLRRYERKLLNPIKDGNGHHRFDPQELRAVGPEIAKRRKRKVASPKPPKDPPRPAGPVHDTEPPQTRVSGEVTKRAFEMFEQGHSRLRVVMELREPVENVDWLWEKYLEFSGKKAAEPARRSLDGASPPSSPAPPQGSTLPRRVSHAPLPCDVEAERWAREIDQRKAEWERTQGEKGSPPG